MFDMFMRTSGTKQHDSFESCLTERLSARITVQTTARHELTKADAFTRSREH